MKPRGEGRIFTKQEADKLLPQVIAMTEQFKNQIEEIQGSLDAGQVPSDHKRQVMLQIDHKVNDWARRMTSWGIQVKGLWLVDFDSGDGFYYCWKLGEDEIEYMHGYEETFADRRPVWKRAPQDDSPG